MHQSIGPLHLNKLLSVFRPISHSFPNFSRNFFQACELTIDERARKDWLFQPNRTKASIIQFLHLQQKAVGTHLKSPEYAQLVRERLALKKRIASQTKIWTLLRPNPRGESLLLQIHSSWSDWPLQRCQLDTEQSLTRALVACQLYRRNTGNLPSRLDDLVPAYLPSAPLDAFDGLPVGYDPAAGFLFSRWPLDKYGSPEMGEDVLSKPPTTRPTQANDTTVLRIPTVSP
jgi:hypothetical protein